MDTRGERDSDRTIKKKKKKKSTDYRLSMATRLFTSACPHPCSTPSPFKEYRQVLFNVVCSSQQNVNDDTTRLYLIVRLFVCLLSCCQVDVHGAVSAMHTFPECPVPTKKTCRGLMGASFFLLFFFLISVQALTSSEISVKKPMCGKKKGVITHIPL